MNIDYAENFTREISEELSNQDRFLKENTNKRAKIIKRLENKKSKFSIQINKLSQKVFKIKKEIDKQKTILNTFL